MTLARTIYDAHPAAPDFLEDLIITDAPVGIMDFDRAKDSGKCLTIAALAFDGGLQETAHTCPVGQPCNRAAARAGR